jgi:hypothetical protein
MEEFNCFIKEKWKENINIIEKEKERYWIRILSPWNKVHHEKMKEVYVRKLFYEKGIYKHKIGTNNIKSCQL